MIKYRLKENVDFKLVNEKSKMNTYVMPQE